jgi:hypothetical protein
MSIQYAQRLGLSIDRFSTTPPLPLLFFGDAGLPYASWAELPFDAPEGATAIDVRSGAAYRAHVWIGKSRWLPALAYGDGTGFAIQGAFDGTEEVEASVTAKGLILDTVGQGTTTLQHGGANKIRLRCAGAADTDNVAAFSSARLSTPNRFGAGAPLGATEDTFVWSVCQRDVISGSSIGGFAQPARIITPAWQVRHGVVASQLNQERFWRGANAALNPNTAWLNTTTEFTAATSSETVELVRTVQPPNTPSAGAARVEALRNGKAYLSVINPTADGAAATWFVDAATSAASGGRIIMDVYGFLVVTRTSLPWWVA